MQVTHVATGREYEVLSVGLESDTMAPMVTYIDRKGVVWIRTLGEFIDGRFVRKSTVSRSRPKGPSGLVDYLQQVPMEHALKPLPAQTAEVLPVDAACLAPAAAASGGL